MTEVFERAAQRFSFNPADIQGPAIANVGRPVPYLHTPALRLLLELKDPAGSRYPKDDSRYLLPPAVVAEGVTEGVFDGAGLVLSGGWFALPALSGLSESYTLAFDLAPSALQPGRNTLLSALDAAGQAEVFSVAVDGQSGAVTVAQGGASASLALHIAAGHRYRLALVWDGAALIGYVDGARVASSGLSASPAAQLGRTLFGAPVRPAPNSADFFTGRLGALGVWSVRLSDLEQSTLAAVQGGEVPLAGRIEGSPGQALSPPALSKAQSAGLVFDGGSEAVRAETLPGRTHAGGGFSLGARWLHNAGDTARAVCGVGGQVALYAEASGRYTAAVFGQAMTMTAPCEDAEVLAAVVGYRPAASGAGGWAFFELVGSRFGRQRVEAQITGEVGFPQGAQQLTVAQDGARAGYLGALYDVSWWPYLALNAGQVATYTRGFVQRPATQTGTLIEPLGLSILGAPIQGEADPPRLEALHPAPLSVDADVDTEIRGQIVDTGDGLDFPSIVISVAGVIAYADGAVRPGFMGSVQADGPGRARFRLSRQAVFGDVQVVSVRVRARDRSPLSNAMDAAYSFTTADATAPFVTGQAPAPGAQHVPQNANIALTVDDAASQVDRSSLTVRVLEGDVSTVAVAAGQLQAPFDGGASRVQPVGRGFSIVLDKSDAVLAESAVIAVTVAAADAYGNQLTEASYRFSTGDQAAPAISLVHPPQGAVGVTPLGDIVFEVTDLGTGVTPGTISLSIDQGSGPQPAMRDGAFLPPFNQPGSTIAQVEGGYRVTVHPAGRLAREQLIALSVSAQDAAGNVAQAGLSFTTGTAGTLQAPVELENDGGGPVSLYGTVPPGRYTVDVVGLPDNQEAPVYNGRAGSGGRAVVVVDADQGRTDATADIYLPPLPIGGPYALRFTPLGGGAGEITTPPCVHIRPRGLDSRTLAVRSSLLPWLSLGPRRSQDLAFPQE